MVRLAKTVFLQVKVLPGGKRESAVADARTRRDCGFQIHLSALRDKSGHCKASSTSQSLWR